MSWDVLSGRTGYISFGHPFLIGIAGYTTATLTYHLAMPALFLSIPIGSPGDHDRRHACSSCRRLRIRGTYFALVTLGLHGTHVSVNPGRCAPI